MKAIYNGTGALRNITLELDATDLKELWRRLAFLDSLPTECGHCGSTEVAPMHWREPEYFKIGCKACKAEINLGMRKNEQKSLYFDDSKKWNIPPARGGSSSNGAGNAWESATPAKPKRPAPPQQRPQDEFPSGEDLPF